MEEVKLNENLETLSETLGKNLDIGNGNEAEQSKGETTDGADAKQRRKLDKLIDGLLRKTNPNLNSIEDKYYALVQKFLDLQEQNKKLQLSGKETEKTIANLTKQKDIAQNDYSKMLLAKDKLENLCRELQKHNKAIKEENLQRIKEEEEKRKEISSKFQLAIDDINKQVSSNTDKNNSIMQENAQLTGKLKNLLEQYEIREQHIEKVLKHKDLEIELANAKFQQSELKFTELEERGKGEKKLFEASCNELIKKCEFHQESEKQLRAQLSVYTEKYEEFQTTLKKSNQVFESFKTEMDKMTKKMHKLEQETVSWKTKWESCDKTLQNCIKIKDELEEKCKKFNMKAEAMEKLSRSLQAERNALKEELKKYEDKEKSAINDDKPVETSEQTQPTVVEEVKEAPDSDANTNSPSEPAQQVDASQASAEPAQISQIEPQPEEKADTQLQPSENN